MIYQKWTLNLIYNDYLSIYTGFNYRIDSFLIIILGLVRGKPPLPTEQYDKFIDFQLIIYRF